MVSHGTDAESLSDSDVAGPLLFAGTVAVGHVLMTCWAIKSLFQWNTPRQKFRDHFKNSYALHANILCEVVRPLVNIGVAFGVAVYVRHDENKCVGYTVSLALISHESSSNQV